MPCHEKMCTLPSLTPSFGNVSCLAVMLMLWVQFSTGPGTNIGIKNPDTFLTFIYIRHIQGVIHKVLKADSTKNLGFSQGGQQWQLLYVFHGSCTFLKRGHWSIDNRSKLVVLITLTIPSYLNMNYNNFKVTVFIGLCIFYNHSKESYLISLIGCHSD